MNFNLDKIRDATRGIGILLISAAVLSGAFQENNPFIALCIIIVGIISIIIGSMEDQP